MNDKLYLDKLKAEVKFLKLESQYIRGLFEDALLEFNNCFKEKLENKKAPQNQKNLRVKTQIRYIKKQLVKYILINRLVIKKLLIN